MGWREGECDGMESRAVNIRTAGSSQTGTMRHISL